ncbi:hypothetical protein ALNOE001_21370 [Candidatus Methanobinarius endosymbioticus]|uniref:Glycerophosphoryl diester phosphodiesterase membrane domain-containing protein n=1 Tax=Candidatus Methanobinarius endosymbioticus TaxID=2006182 RepID=A0A366M9I8_9EURY|nr:hypothetical protein ALNOE001_21370 [Candidatus Methanobinarius endosymbioticus]
MEIVELFKDALTYPIKEWNKLLLFGVLFVVMSIFSILQVFGLALTNYAAVGIVGIISFVVTFVFTMLIFGYILSIIRKTINNVSGDVPKIDLATNFVDGLKVLVLYIVYYIIPVVITLIVAYATGAFNYLYQFMMIVANTGSVNAVPQALMANAGANLLIVAVIAMILYIIFTLLLWIATVVLAETDSLGAAVHMGNVFKKIGEISWVNYIIWAIILAIITFIIGFVSDLILYIPFLGFILSLLIISPFLEMFKTRALGLIYNESKR